MKKTPTITVEFCDKQHADCATVTINGKRARFNKRLSSRRACYVAAGFIVKIGDCDDWASEHARYKSIFPKDRKYFVPIVASGKVSGRPWIAQPFMKFRPGRISNHAIELIGKLVDRYDLFDVTYMCAGWSVDKNNWAILPSGQPIIYDYEL